MDTNADFLYTGSNKLLNGAWTTSWTANNIDGKIKIYDVPIKDEAIKASFGYQYDNIKLDNGYTNINAMMYGSEVKSGYQYNDKFNPDTGYIGILGKGYENGKLIADKLSVFNLNTKTIQWEKNLTGSLISSAVTSKNLLAYTKEGEKSYWWQFDISTGDSKKYELGKAAIDALAGKYGGWSAITQDNIGNNYGLSFGKTDKAKAETELKITLLEGKTSLEPAKSTSIKGNFQLASISKQGESVLYAPYVPAGNGLDIGISKYDFNGNLLYGVSMNDFKAFIGGLDDYKQYINIEGYFEGLDGNILAMIKVDEDDGIKQKEKMDIMR